MAATLTPKQAAFVAEYLVDLNATRAAIRAGYSAANADKIGSQLLGKSRVAESIHKAMQKRESRTEITQDRVLQEYAKLAFLDPRKFYDADGNLIDIPNLPADVAAAISGMDIVVEKAGTDENGSPVFAQVRKIKLADKKGALDSVARHLGMFNDKISQTINAEVKGEIKHTLPPELQSVLDSVYGQESQE